ncbi:MAG TPA: hypothetical protein VFO60_02445, partial [Candidatus Dormibacteraeota bacterium]|nr:hypothetical protein [Candidatus Dormibacteraeota bacterium]
GAPSAPAGAVAASAASEGVEGAPNLADRSRPAAPRRRARPERVTGMPDRGTPRADRPANVPAPQHHHLPGWVRRDFSRARPALADILGILQGEDRAQFQQRVDELTAGITAGKFSLAWQYPALIEEGQKLLESQRTRLAENQRAQRLLDGTRRRSADRLREAAEVLGPEAAARLGRSLRQAPDAAAIAEIDAEVDKALSAARSVGSRRRDREIERTRSRLFRTVPKAALAEEPQSESWQDVLRRFAEEQGMEQQTAGAGTAD